MTSLDISTPSSVLVSTFLSGKISDFGTARGRTNSDLFLTSTGTPLFCAPEVMRGESYDERADVYSFGLVLLAMCVEEGLGYFLGSRYGSLRARRRGSSVVVGPDGRAKAKSLTRVVTAMTGAEGWRPVTPEHLVPDTPAGINRLIVACCAADPRSRPAFETILALLQGEVKDEVDAESFARYRGESAPLGAGQKQSPRADRSLMKTDDDFSLAMENAAAARLSLSLSVSNQEWRRRTSSMAAAANRNRPPSMPPLPEAPDPAPLVSAPPAPGATEAAGPPAGATEAASTEAATNPLQVKVAEPEPGPARDGDFI